MSEHTGGHPAALAVEVLCRLAEAIGRAERPAEIYDAALDALRDGVGVSRASILLFDPAGVMRFVAWRGLSGAYRSAVEGHSPWSPETPDAVPIVVADVEVDASLERYLPLFREEGIGAMLFIPLMTRDRVIGKFMCYADAPRAFPPAEIRLATAVARQVAFAVARTNTEIECARLTAQAEFLADLTAALNRTLDYAETLNVLAQLAVPRVSDLCILHMREDGAVRARAVVEAHSGQAGRLQGLLAHGLLDAGAGGGVTEVLRTGRSRCLSPVRAADLVPAGTGAQAAAALEGLDLRSAMIVPLRTSNGVVGAMTLVATARSGRVYGRADVALVEEVAARAAIALENALLYRVAQEANRQKDEFLATLSHELRTPLNAVLGWARMLEGGRLPPDRAHQAIATIRRNAETQARLIADILDVARIVSGKLQLALDEHADASRIVAASVEAFEDEARRKGVAFTMSIEPGLVATLDPARLQQIVWNLVSNAVKFTPPGGHVDTTFHFEDEGLTLRVTDDGAGIDPAFLPHLFERFRQADPTTTRSHAGLGLGLAITRHLTELHGGAVHAASDGPGRGSTFIVRLPGSITRAAREPEAPRGSIDGIVHRLRGCRLLVVDDDADARQLLAVMLGDAGAEVTTAASAREAFAHLQREGWDLLVADIAMPGEDGFELLSRVRAMGADADRLPAIAVTAHARDDDRRRALLAGFQGHLPKPVDQEALLEMVATALERRAGA